MQIDLSGKSAIITGSTAGIGFAIAQGWPHPAQTPWSTVAPRTRWIERSPG
jgi:hypothetical protein